MSESPNFDWTTGEGHVLDVSTRYPGYPQINPRDENKGAIFSNVGDILRPIEPEPDLSLRGMVVRSEIDSFITTANSVTVFESPQQTPAMREVAA